MIKKLPIFLLIILCSCQAQEKVKGSRNVQTEEYNLTPFHSIELAGDFQVGILKGSRPMIEIKADDNLHDLIQTEVVDGVLYVRPIKEFSRTKAQEIKIEFSDTLKKISISDKIELESLEDLFVNSFQLETKNDSRAFLTLTASNFTLVNGDDSKAELNVTAKETYYQLNQSSKVESLVNSPVFKVDIYEKANARIDGDIEEFELRADQSAEFDGENLACVNAVILAQGDSENKINVLENLQIRAKGNSETDIFNDPEIELLEFTDEAVIAKKNFGKGLFK